MDSKKSALSQKLAELRQKSYEAEEMIMATDGNDMKVDLPEHEPTPEWAKPKNEEKKEDKKEPKYPDVYDKFFGKEKK